MARWKNRDPDIQFGSQKAEEDRYYKRKSRKDGNYIPSTSGERHPRKGKK